MVDAATTLLVADPVAPERTMPTSASAPPRFDVLGVGVSAVSMSSAVRQITSWIESGTSAYVCVTGVHGVMESGRDPSLRAIHNASGLTVPDGVPLVWSGRYAGFADVTRVYGPDLMLAMCREAAARGWSSFLYGAAPGTPEELARRLRARFPGLDVAGTMSPPFRPLTEAEDREVVDAIRRSGARLVWVGLSTPKQERWMADHLDRLPGCVLLGVGAAFDFHAGRVRQAPRWLQRAGLEWAFRMACEPRRLAKRYLRNNPGFVVRIARRRPAAITGGA